MAQPKCEKCGARLRTAAAAVCQTCQGANSRETLPFTEAPVPGEWRYDAQGEIARGGMGAVVRGVDREIRREVAIKYLLNPGDPRQAARFFDEARITGQLEHPNIVPIHELGTDPDGRPYFVMKMVRGRSLADVVAELKSKAEAGRVWSLSRLVGVLIGVCHGLEYAHARGVIHRDLKPANIMVGDFGEVYVMDWGLAKLLSEEEPGRPNVAVLERGGLTQDGAVLGTPAYMPPEQASGQLQDVDRRSDIYSLGGILYTLLTLEPPVESGGMITVLMQVADGKIQPPAIRTPARAAAIPAELSAVAMKALATERDQRYQSVEEFRRDLERYRAGRSVSAKKDTSLELVRKFVRRNKTACVAGLVGLFLAFGVLAGSAAVNYQARLRADEARDRADEERQKAEENHAAFVQEQQAKRSQAKRSAPAFLRAARLLCDERQFDDGLTQLSLALEFDPGLAEARLFQGQVLLGLERYEEALVALKAYADQRPDDAAGRRLIDLAAWSRPRNAGYYRKLAGEFADQKIRSLADRATRLAAGLVAPKQEKLKEYQRLLDRAWAGAGRGLHLVEDRFDLTLRGVKGVSDLSPLREIPLGTLNLSGADVDDLGPLKDMPLTSLDLSGCKRLSDLRPLEKLDLRTLNLTGCGLVRDLKPLSSMRRLERLNLRDCRQVEDLGPLRDLPLKNLELLDCWMVRDLEPLSKMKLVVLNVSNCSRVTKLSPLKGMPLERLYLGSVSRPRDFDVLRDMPLKHLHITAHHLESIDFLEKLPLEQLWLNCKNVKSLAPLRNAPLRSLRLFETPASDLDVLKGKATLRHLELSSRSRPRDLEFLRGLKLNYLDLYGVPIDDLGPLEGIELKHLGFTYGKVKKGWEVIENMNSLERISPRAGVDLPAKEFWRRHINGELK